MTNEFSGRDFRDLVNDEMSVEDNRYTTHSRKTVRFFSDWMNVMSFNPARVGRWLGTQFHREHRTLQGVFINFLLGCIRGISEQAYTDARNETGVASCQRIVEMLDTGEIYQQPFI